MVIRHLLSIASLPFTMAVLIPIWIARRDAITPAPGNGPLEWLLQLAGLAILIVGLTFFFSSLRRFAIEGKGTLAPWDPPRQLVVRGPYRYVRNPMISGLIIVLFGESLVLLSMAHAQWALLFLVINLVYVPLFEEPQLEGRFGESYRDYCKHVPRVFPRFTPWSPSDHQ